MAAAERTKNLARPAAGDSRECPCVSSASSNVSVTGKSVPAAADSFPWPVERVERSHVEKGAVTGESARSNNHSATIFRRVMAAVALSKQDTSARTLVLE